MSETMAGRPVAPGKRALVFLGAMMATMAMYFAVTASSALAEGPFCERAYLQPYGHNGDRCWGPARAGMESASVITYERAGCVDIANGSNELMFSWVCGSAGSAPGFAASIYDFNHVGIYRKGVIRNNNLSFAAYFTGHEIYSF
jgi:hypothetical protein